MRNLLLVALLDAGCGVGEVTPVEVHDGWRLVSADALLLQLGHDAGLDERDRRLARARVLVLAASDALRRVPVRASWDGTGAALIGGLPGLADVGVVEPVPELIERKRRIEACKLVEGLPSALTLRADGAPVPWTGRPWAQVADEPPSVVPPRAARAAADEEAERRAVRALGRLGWSPADGDERDPADLVAALGEVLAAVDVAPGDAEVHAWWAVVRVRALLADARSTSCCGPLEGIVEGPAVRYWPRREHAPPLSRDDAAQGLERALALARAEILVASTPGAEDAGRAAATGEVLRGIGAWLVAFDDLDWLLDHVARGFPDRDMRLDPALRAVAATGRSRSPLSSRERAVAAEVRALLPPLGPLVASIARPCRTDPPERPINDPRLEVVVAHRSTDDPEHVPADLAVATHPVTRAQWEVVSGSPWFANDCLVPWSAMSTLDSNAPISCATVRDAAAFANALSVRDQLEPVYLIREDTLSWRREADGWRLPTAAEWDRADAQGALGRGGWGWTSDVREWVWPLVDGELPLRIRLRAGVPAADLRPGGRSGLWGDDWAADTGFRVVRTIARGSSTP